MTVLATATARGIHPRDPGAAGKPPTIVGAVSTESSATLDRTESYAASLYERHKAAIFRHCLKQLRRREDADDAVQTTFVYALLSLRRGVVPRTELPWLFTIAGNVCSSRRRSGLRRGSLETPQDLDSLQDVIPTPERFSSVSADDFLSALRAMPDTQRKALLLREWKGLSYNEIAEELGLSQAATETLLFRARRTLARKLEDKAGVRTANGVSLASLIRSLLPAGAGKTLAVALGAAATFAAAPAVERHVVHGSPQAAVASPRRLERRTAMRASRVRVFLSPRTSLRSRAPPRVSQPSWPAPLTRSRSSPKMATQLRRRRTPTPRTRDPGRPRLRRRIPRPCSSRQPARSQRRLRARATCSMSRRRRRLSGSCLCFRTFKRPASPFRCRQQRCDSPWLRPGRGGWKLS